MANVKAPFLSRFASGKFANSLVCRQGKLNNFIMYTPTKLKKVFSGKQIEYQQYWKRLQLRLKLLKRLDYSLFVIGWTEIGSAPDVNAMDYYNYIKQYRHSCIDFRRIRGWMWADKQKYFYAKVVLHTRYGLRYYGYKKQYIPWGFKH